MVSNGHANLFFFLFFWKVDRYQHHTDDDDTFFPIDALYENSICVPQNKLGVCTLEMNLVSDHLPRL